MIRLFQDGGPFMWVLLAWSILVIGFFLERLWTYLRARKEVVNSTHSILRE